jgi:hypothetical protein
LILSKLDSDPTLRSLLADSEWAILAKINIFTNSVLHSGFLPTDGHDPKVALYPKSDDDFTIIEQLNQRFKFFNKIIPKFDLMDTIYGSATVITPDSTTTDAIEAFINRQYAEGQARVYSIERDRIYTPTTLNNPKVLRSVPGGESNCIRHMDRLTSTGVAALHPDIVVLNNSTLVPKWLDIDDDELQSILDRLDIPATVLIYV